MSAVTPRSSRCSPTAAGFSGCRCFLSLGYFLGERWETVEGEVRHYAVLASCVGAVALGTYLIWRKWFRR